MEWKHIYVEYTLDGNGKSIFRFFGELQEIVSFMRIDRATELV